MNKRQIAYLEKARTHAVSKEGACLSDTYSTIKDKLQWKCKEGHEWERNYEKTINRDIWCTACFHAERERLESMETTIVHVVPDPVPRKSSPSLHFLDVIFYPYEIITQQYVRDIVL